MLQVPMNQAEHSTQDRSLCPQHIFCMAYLYHDPDNSWQQYFLKDNLQDISDIHLCNHMLRFLPAE